MIMWRKKAHIKALVKETAERAEKNGEANDSKNFYYHWSNNNALNHLNI